MLYSSRKVSELKSTLIIDLDKSLKQNLLNGVSKLSNRISTVSVSFYKIKSALFNPFVNYLAYLNSWSLLSFFFCSNVDPSILNF